jgi:hypothetical protein
MKYDFAKVYSNHHVHMGGFGIVLDRNKAFWQGKSGSHM